MLPSGAQNPSSNPAFTDADVMGVVLQALRTANLARNPDDQLTVSEDAALFGPDSPLDSLGLVALLLDVEEGLADIGLHVVLSDERAMSQKRSPFRSVQSLVAYVGQLARS
jgi:acyl carrier protein